MDEDLAVGDVAVGGGADEGEEGGVGDGGGGEEVDQLLLGVGFEELLDIVGASRGIGRV